MSAQRLSSVAVARLAAAAATQSPDVLALYGGAVGEIATYAPGGQAVRGVRVRAGPTRRVELHITARFGARLDDVADDVRRRVAAALVNAAPDVAGAPIDVRIADVRREESP